MSKILTQVPQINKRALAPEDICRTVAADFKAHNISHAEAADMLQVKTRSVSNQISGKRPFGKKTAQKYAKAFGYEESFLLYGLGTLRKETSYKSKPYTYKGKAVDEKMILSLVKHIAELEEALDEQKRRYDELLGIKGSVRGVAPTSAKKSEIVKSYSKYHNSRGRITNTKKIIDTDLSDRSILAPAGDVGVGVE